MRPLVEDLHERREQGEARRRRGEDRPPARARQAHGPRADRPAGRPGHVRRDGHPRRSALLPALDGGPRGAGRRRDHRLGRRRRPAVCDRGLRLHGDGGLDGNDRGAEGGPPARAGAAEADAADLAARLGRGANPGGGGQPVRRLRTPVPRGGDDVGRRAAGGRDARPLRGGDRLHPGALGFRADGGRPGRDGARGPAPDQGRDRRGHLDGGPRRRQGPLPQVGGRRPRGEGRPRVHRGGQDLSLLLPGQLRAEAAAAPHGRSRRPHVRGAARHRPRVKPPALRHVRA